MRILFAGPVPPLRGGIAQHGARLVEALRAAHDVDVVTWRALYPRLLYKHDQRDEAAEPLAGARALLSWSNPLSWRRTGRLGRDHGLVVLPWVTPFHALACRAIAKGAAPTPTVAIVHNALPHEPMPMQLALTRRGLERAAGIVVHSASVGAELTRLFGFREPVLVPHPPNLALEATPLPGLEDGLRLLFLGFVRSYKGLDIALEALAELRTAGREASLTVAGEFWDSLEDWRTKVRDKGLADHVDLRPGYQSDDTVRALLEHHHVLVAPYRSATQSGVVPLAHAAGRPVVATDVGGLAEQVGEAGAIVPPEDPAAFAQAVARVADDLEAQAGRARAQASSWQDVVEAVLRAGGIA